MKPLLWLALAAVGCSAGTPVYLIDGRATSDPEAAWERLEEACAFWGVDCTEGGRGSAAIVVFGDGCGAAPDGHKVCGITKHDNCQPFVWVGDVDSLALEHELGHAFGDLADDGPALNIMASSLDTNGMFTTEEQRAAVRRGAEGVGCL